MTVGSRVRTVDGRLGTVVALYRDHGCGCLSVIVRLESGREWAGKASEVEPWR